MTIKYVKPTYLKTTYYPIYIFLACFVLPIKTIAQKKEILDADIFFDEYLFVEAINKYTEAIPKITNEKSEIYVLSQIARCYQYSFNYVNAEYYFKKLVEKTNEKNAEFLLELGIMYKFNGKYLEAKEQFRKYQKITEGQDPYGSFQLRSVNWAINNDTINKPIFVARTNLDISGQTLGYSIWNKGIVYAHARNKEPYFSMPIFSLDYAIRLDSLNFENEGAMFDSLGFKGNEGFPSVTSDGKRIYFAANASVIRGGKAKKLSGNKRSVLNFKIYQATFTNGKFMNVVEMPFNHQEYNCTHPFITKDESSIYFASDMPGGFGGYDLYVSKKQKDGSWSKPLNLGKSVNSEENEIFPFINGNNFYYSSKGMNGYGGYDIYVANVSSSGMVLSPQNLGKPYNSFRDDYAYVSYDDGMSGYLSSNRANDDGEDEVFFFKDLRNLTIDQIKLLTSNADSKRKSEAEKQKITAAQKQADLDSKLEIAKAEQQKNIALDESNKNNTTDNNTQELAMQNTQSKIEEDPDGALLKMIFNNVNFGFNESKLVPEVLTILDSAATTIRMGNQIKIEVSAHTDSRGSSEYNKALSLRRATEARTYLLSKGVPASKIIIRGYGEDRLINHCKDNVQCSEEEHAVNRRVELRLVR
jgi:outer membrane protein OmpA-like peptidoglycan-associated protein